MKTLNRFYTYAYLREDRTPYYIGKGTGKRIYSTNRNGLKPPKDKSKIIFLKQNLTEEEAFKHEKYMIAVFGRIDIGTGILRNLTDGGEGASGVIVGKEHRKKISKALQGKIVSKETRRRMSEAQKGKSPSEKTRQKMSEAQKGENHPMYGKRGKNNPNYGKIPSEEHRRKISEAKKGKAQSEEHKRKLSEVQKKKRWWNDGCGNTKFAEKCPGINWISGRGKLKKQI